MKDPCLEAALRFVGKKSLMPAHRESHGLRPCIPYAWEFFSRLGELPKKYRMTVRPLRKEVAA